MADSPLDSWVGGRIQRVSQRGTNAIRLDLFHPQASLPSRCSRWLISATPEASGIHPSSEPHQNAPNPPIFCLWLRTRILNGRVAQWAQLHPRVQEVTIDQLKDKRVQRFHLVHEDNGSDSNLLLLDEERHLLIALRNPNQSGRSLAKGKPYTQPNHWHRSRPEAREQSEAAQTHGQQAVWQQHLKRLCKQLHRRLQHLEVDQTSLSDAHRFRRWGDLLKSKLHELQPGQAEIIVLEYSENELAEVCIPLNPQESPQQNLKVLYRRAEKLERSRPHVKRRITETQSQLESLGVALEQLAGLRDDVAVAAWESRLPLWMQATRPREVNKTSSKRTKVSGPLIRISSDGLEIWVGRNARENETVTFRWAKGNDWWLHAQGVGGAHVVIRNFGGDLPTRTLEEAAQLATYFSKLRKAGRAEVDYTRRKHVRRVRGGPAGLVHFSQNRTLQVRLNSELVNRLLARTTV